MKSFIVLAVLVAVAVAAPRPGSSGPDAEASVLRYDFDNIGVDGYSYNVETSNGISTQEQGQLQNAGTDNEFLIVRGQFSYTGSDGVLYKVVYEAGPDGFKAEGDHLPRAQ